MNRKKRILIVEDEIIVAQEIMERLCDAGYDVLDIITSGAEAIKQVVDQQPDLVLLEIMLSDKASGIDIASGIQFYNIPVIYITTGTENQISRKIAQSGVYGYLAKPFGKHELITTIEIALTKHETFQKLKENERKYHSLFDNMQNGLAYHKLIVNSNGEPVDYIYLNANDAFEKLLGLKRENIIGKRVTEVFPGINTESVDWIGTFGLVALTGNSISFEGYLQALNKWFSINCYSTQKGYFTTIFEDSTTRRQALELSEKSHEDLRNLTLYMDTKVEEEKKKIAREIHDELGQLLTAIKINLSLIEKSSAGQQENSERIDSMKNMIDSGIQTIHDITKELRPIVLDDLGIVAALQTRITDFEKSSGIKTDFIYHPEYITLDSDLAVSIYRIFLELFTNIIRHSKSKKVTMKLKKYKTIISFTVRDFGRGITEEQISGSLSFGLIGIRERLNIWNGKMEIKGVSGKGTIVKIKIPI